MTARKLGVVVTVFFTVCCVSAADRIWTGGGSDANWSTDANWGGTAPAANDTLIFGGTAKLQSVNDFPDDTLFAGIIFSSGAGAFTLSGNRITLGGNVANLSTSAQTINLPVALPDISTFNASNGALTVNGVLSGAGGLTKIGLQALTLTASNSYDGVTTVDNGMLHITHGHALGSTNGHTLVNSKSSTVGGGLLQLSGNIDVPEPLTLFGERNSPNTLGRSSLFNISGNNTWSGPITRKSGGNNTRIHLRSGSRLNITGGVTGGGAGLFVLRMNTATIAFYEKPINIGSDKIWIEESGTIILGATNNVWGDTPNLGWYNTLRMGVANALAPTTHISMTYQVNAWLTLDLNSLDQRIGKLSSMFCTSGDRIITTPAPATLTVDQDVDTHLDARLEGPLTLVKTGTGMLTLSNSVASTATTTGDIIVSNGTLRVAAPGCLGNAANVTVAGGTLSLQSAATIDDAANLFITPGAHVEIADGVTEVVETLFINGVQQVRGSWGTTASGATHTDDTLFMGTGKIYVIADPPFTAADAVWDAGGADTFASTAANWTDDVVPAFDGTTRAYFGNGGTAALFNTAARLYGITFNATNDFTVDSGTGTLAIGAGGITAAIPDTTSRTYTLAGEAFLSYNQTWTVTTNLTGKTTLQVSAAIHDEMDLASFDITKKGLGNLLLSGNNSYNGITYLNEGTLTIAHDNALGRTNGPTLIADGAWIEMKDGITVNEPLSLPGDASTRWSGGLRVTGGSNVWAGKITSSPANSRIVCNAGSLDITGGITGGQMCLGGNGGSYLRVSGAPINTPDKPLFAHTSIPIILAMTNNAWTSLLINGNFVRTDLDNVLPPSSGLMIEAANKTGIDLNGHNQAIQKLEAPHKDGTTTILCSPTPATLTVNQTADTAFFASITGAVTLVKNGSGRLTLARACTTSGDFVVSNGTLAVSETGALGENSTNIWVAGGTLSLSNSAAISDQASLFIADGGSAKVELAAGVNESVGYLYFGDKMQRAGTYSATAGAGVQHVDVEHFAGSGILRVRHDTVGTLIRVR